FCKSRPREWYWESGQLRYQINEAPISRGCCSCLIERDLWVIADLRGKMRVSVIVSLFLALLYSVDGRQQAARPVVGLEIGQQAPAFTLRGPKGTVLLFFRSADW